MSLLIHPSLYAYDLAWHTTRRQAGERRSDRACEMEGPSFLGQRLKAGDPGAARGPGKNDELPLARLASDAPAPLSRRSRNERKVHPRTLPGSASRPPSRERNERLTARMPPM